MVFCQVIVRDSFIRVDIKAIERVSDFNGGDSIVAWSPSYSTVHRGVSMPKSER